MNEYLIETPAHGTWLQWFAETEQQARKEAESAGHKVRSIRFVRAVPEPNEKEIPDA